MPMHQLKKDKVPIATQFASREESPKRTTVLHTTAKAIFRFNYGTVPQLKIGSSTA